MRVIVKVWNEKEADAEAIVDMNAKLNVTNLDFLIGIMESYLPQSAMKAKKVEQPKSPSKTENIAYYIYNK